MADRLGPAVASQLDGGRVLLLMATRFRADGLLEPDLALELDRDGQVLASQFLDLRHRDDEDDEFSDLGDEEPLPDRLDLSHARPAKRCECPEPFGDGGLCLRCGHTLPLPL